MSKELWPKPSADEMPYFLVHQYEDEWRTLGNFGNLEAVARLPRGPGDHYRLFLHGKEVALPPYAELPKVFEEV